MERYEANKYIRLLLCVTCEYLAGRVGVTKQTISNYERGIHIKKPTQRIIELELDQLISEVQNDTIRNVCLLLQSCREGNSQNNISI